MTSGRHILAICLVTAVQAISAAQNPPLPGLPELARVPPEIRAQAQQAYDEAVKNPANASANGKLGMLLHARQLNAEAEVCYRRAHALDPSSFDWNYYLALVEMDRGEFQEAAEILRRALRQNPKYLPAELRLGECLLASGKWQEAAQFYGTMAARHPDRAEPYYGLARIKALGKDSNAAVQLFQKACRLFPGFGPAHYGLAHVYKRLGKMDLAVAQLALYEKGPTLTPDEGDNLFARVKALGANGQDEFTRGLDLAKSGKFDAAAEAFENVLRKDPTSSEAHTKLIAIYGQLGDPVKAEEHYQAAVRLDAKNPETYFDHGLLLANQERFVEAEAAFRKALEIDPHYPNAQLNAGSMLEAQGKPSEASAEYLKILESHPDDAQAHFSLGRIFVNQEQYKEGIDHLLESIKTGNQDSQPTYLYALGAAYARSGDGESAKRYLHMAREKAAEQGQEQLVESIDGDLRTLEGDGGQR